MDAYAISGGREDNSLYYNHILTQDLINLLNTSLTKYNIAILKELYHSPHTQQKTLAANLHTTPNSLSNMLNKMENIHPQLLIVEKIGRSKYYTLTEIAELYISQEILPQTAKIHAFSLQHEDALTKEALTLLSYFQKAAGTDWYIVLDDMLSRRTISHTRADELNDLYNDFVDNMKQLKMLNQLASIQEIYNILNQPILIRRLNDYLAAELKRYYALEPLFILERQDFDKAVLLIDYIFSKLKPSIFPTPYLPPSFKEISVSQEQYSGIYCEFITMIDEFGEYQGNTIGAATYWKSIYLSDSMSFYLIAEKCHSVPLPGPVTQNSPITWEHVK